jgi:hypothetical protein
MSSINLTNIGECEGNGSDENGNKVDPITLEPINSDLSKVVKIGNYCFNADTYKEYLKRFSWDNYAIDFDEETLDVWLNEIYREENQDTPFRSGFGPILTREQLTDLYNKLSTYENHYNAAAINKRKNIRRKNKKTRKSRKPGKTGKTGKKNKRHLTKRRK